MIKYAYKTKFMSIPNYIIKHYAMKRGWVGSGSVLDNVERRRIFSPTRNQTPIIQSVTY
jgi:hypothetical protein